MQKRTKWILGAAAALVISGSVFAVPALAQNLGYGHMSAFMGSANMQKMHQQMMNSGSMAQMHQQMMGSEMMAMHEAMAPLMSQMPAMHDQVMGEVAGHFDMTLDELNAALAEGKTLEQLADEKKVAAEEIISIMTQNMKSFLDSAVEAGTITREQADQMTEMHQQHSTDCLNGGGMHGMMFGTSNT